MTSKKTATEKATSPEKEVAVAASKEKEVVKPIPKKVTKKVSKFIDSKTHFGTKILVEGLIVTDTMVQYKTLDGCVYKCTKAEYDALK